MNSENGITRIKEWLADSGDYSTGLEILASYPKMLKAKTYSMLLGGEQRPNNRHKLEHEIKKLLARLEPAQKPRIPRHKIKEENSVVAASIIPEVSTESSVEEIVTAIRFWLQGSRDYNQGKELLKLVPGGFLTGLQLASRETYCDQVRLAHWLRQGIQVLIDN